MLRHHVNTKSGGTNKGDSRQVPQWGSAPSSSTSSGSSENWQQQARKLLKLEEVAALSERTAITFTPGETIAPLNKGRVLGLEVRYRY